MSHKRVHWDAYRQITSGDLNDGQAYPQQAMDHLIHDAVTNDRRYAGFAVTKSSGTVAAIALGRLYLAGQMHTHETEHYTIDFFSQLPLSTKKIVAIVASGTEVDTETEQRKYLTDAGERTTQVQATPTIKHRTANISTQSGAESAAPTKPTVSESLVTVAWVTLNTTGIESIEQNVAAQVESIKHNDVRLTSLEGWRDQTGNRIDTLASDMTGILARLGGSGSALVMTQLATDVGRIKEILELEADHTDYGADRYLNDDDSDTDHVNYLARVEEGVRFPNAGEDESALALFNPINPDAIVSNGWLLPKYTSVPRIVVDNPVSELSISQYAYQTVDYTLLSVTRQRTRYGEPFVVCNNSAWWRTGNFDMHRGVFYKGGDTWQVLDQFQTGSGVAGHDFIRIRKVWTDTVTEPYWDRIITEGTVSGSLVAQTFLNSQSGWMTKLDLPFTQVGPSGNVDVMLCYTRDGKPDLSRVIKKVAVTHADLKVYGTDGWTSIAWPATYLKPGERYGIVIMTGGNHYVGLASGADYAQGTLFYSTDGAFFMGDLTKDIAFRIHCAKFDVPRIEIELDALSLSGGIAAIDLLAETIVPEGTRLIYEIQPSGSTQWFALDTLVSGNTKLFGLPALVKLRAVFLGSTDVMPGVNLVTSRMNISRPGTALTHISEAVTLASTTQSLKIVVTMNEYYETNHNLTCVIDDVTNAANAIAPATTTDVELGPGGDANHKRIKRTFEWTAAELTTATDEFVIKLTGSTTSALDVFVVEERIHLAF